VCCQPKELPSADNTQTVSGFFGLPEDGAPAAPKHVGARLIFWFTLKMHLVGLSFTKANLFHKYGLLSISYYAVP
jgi:hypothetical protein